jgi:hypothetical protein
MGLARNAWAQWGGAKMPLCPAAQVELRSNVGLEFFDDTPRTLGQCLAERRFRRPRNSKEGCRREQGFVCCDLLVKPRPGFRSMELAQTLQMTSAGGMAPISCC